MGGLIAADVALLFRHRIIGTIEFDVPFLGMHPGIVKAGLGSIFKPWPMPVEPNEETDDRKPSRMNTLFNPKPSDPNFNPSFYNDVHLPVRKGWENTLHWLTKHSSGVIEASKSLVQQHLEFGGAMADFRTLKSRYARIRALEEDDEEKRRSANPQLEHPPRIRFVNYWTASTGRPKKPKSPPPSTKGDPKHQDSNTSNLTAPSQLTLDTTRSSIDATIPTEPVEQHVGEETIPAMPQDPTSPGTSFSPTTSESRPELPEIPPIPKEPPFVDLADFTDRAQRKAAEKEHDQAMKEYHKAVKARNKVFNERDRIEEKWEKRMQKQKQQQGKQEGASVKETATHDKHDIQNMEKDTVPDNEAPEYETLDEDVAAMNLGGSTINSQSANSPYSNYDFSNSTIMNQTDPKQQPNNASSSASAYTESTHSLATTDSNTTLPVDPNNPNSNHSQKKTRIRKFCILPPKDAHGNKDPAWVKVDMGAIDEVAAHTQLFFVTDRYERLVGDVGARIEDWVREADGMRAAREMEGLF
jgi:hypothetical protein